MRFRQISPRRLNETTAEEYRAEHARLTAEYERYRTAFQTERTRENLQGFHRMSNAIQALQDAWTAQKAAEEPAKAPQQANPDDYRGQHTAPGKDGGAPMFDLTLNGIYPEDFYGGRMRDYVHEDSEYAAASSCLSARNRPNMPVTIYRSVPKDVPRKINVGDWVTTSKRYAVEHGRAHLKNDFNVVSKTVCARDIFTEGDSLNEWGYDPQPRVIRQR
ncbi:MAG: hypothetical protein EOP83_03480 [Verrucomicrobiaceae bacterium]|nr:MAG: hypothetical protein EOP83_03480 [Verrucomicrobiaceae bacterium]